MAKRKETEDAEERPHSLEDSSDSSDEDTNMLDVEFEWFDPQPEHDFQGLKILLRQLLDVDAQLFDLSSLADLILEQPLLGSTVKVDGNETDPYAFLTVLNLRQHMEKPVIKNMISYITQQATTSSDLLPLKDVLENSEVGLILTERLINIPAEVSPPMYKMLLEEINWAIEEKEPYTFSHYLILSKTYQEVVSALDTQMNRPSKKKKKELAKEAKKEMFYFHPEDEIVQRYAALYGGYEYKNKEADGQSDARRTFQELGIKPQGHLMLIEASKFQDTVQAMEDYLRPS